MEFIVLIFSMLSFWTPAEQREYNACLPGAMATFKNQQAAENYCLVHEEHARWLRNHPAAAKRKEDGTVMQSCLQRHTDKINGTPAEFRTAYDGCISEAHGLTSH
jgi:hypothetical protein